MGNNVFKLTIFTPSAPSRPSTDTTSRVAILSDAHYKAFNGVGGYSSAERCQIMTEALLADPIGFDCVIFNGDMVNSNDLVKKREVDASYNEEDWTREFDTEYADKLRAAGIDVFYVNASHDSLTPDEFEAYSGYSHNYVVLVGTTAYICVDTFSGPRSETGETTVADIPEEFVDEIEKLLSGENITDAFVVCHSMCELENFKRLVSLEKVCGTVWGHTHNNQNGVWDKKLSIQTGHFSRGYTKMLTKGLGFKPFVPLNDAVVGKTVDEDGRAAQYDYSATGSPWQYTIVELRGNADGYVLESYQIFPEEVYKEFVSDGIKFAAFKQPYTEARPSFLGTKSPIDRSYALVKDTRKK